MTAAEIAGAAAPPSVTGESAASTPTLSGGTSEPRYVARRAAGWDNAWVVDDTHTQRVVRENGRPRFHRTEADARAEAGRLEHIAATGIWCDDCDRYHQPRERRTRCRRCHALTLEVHAVCQACRAEATA